MTYSTPPPGTGRFSPSYAYDPQYFDPLVKKSCYGDHQQYLVAAEDAIKAVAEKIQADGIRVDFHELLALLSRRRSEVAFRTKTPHAENFGVRRVEEEVTPFRFPLLVLGGQYKAAGERLSETVFSIFKDAMRPSTVPFDKPLTINRKDSPVSSFNLEFMDVETVKKKGYDKIHWELGLGTSPADKVVNPLIYCGFCRDGKETYEMFVKRRPHLKAELERCLSGEVEASKSRPPDALWAAIMREEKEKDRQVLVQGWKDFKKQVPTVPGMSYGGIKLAIGITELKRNFSEPQEGCDSSSTDKTHYLFFTMRHKVGEKMYAISQYVTWLNHIRGEPVDRTLDRAYQHSHWVIIHQDIFLQTATLEECNGLFQYVMQWKKTDGLEDLKMRMAPLMYLLSHNHRDIRGTAAENEWLERAIYRSFGFHVHTLPDRMFDLEAFSSCYSTFRDTYGTSFDLVEIE
ncbi:MAG: hypothetical protein FJZ61_03815 [Chlamydiae bacterium]|nr:hypothetical protein [Chlamydiota bacterium]